MNLFGEEPSSAPIETQDLTVPVDIKTTEGLQHPRLMNISIGHEMVETKLLELFQSGRMPHGLIFSGQKGIGKATMAYRLARFLLSQEQTDPNQDALFAPEPLAQPTSLIIAPDHATFRQIASGGHPDFMSVEREFDTAKNRYKASVPVDAIRKVPGFLRMTASNGGWRVVIIDDADTMNRNAQNALLKVLEEPPKNTVLILVTHRLGALIPTIRSRTQLIHFNPLTSAAVQQLITQSDMEIGSAQIETLQELSDGSIGKLTEYVEQGGLETLEQILSLLKYYPHWKWDEIHAIADNLARPGQDQAYQSFASLMCWLFSQLCVQKARGHTPTRLANFATNSSLEDLLEICENLQSHFKRIDGANLDKRQAILGAFSIIG